jgi:hypothetical protein
MDNMNNTNQELYDRINRLIGRDTIELPAQAIPADVNNKSIYLPALHQLLEPSELIIGKSYYAIDIKNKENVIEGQIKNHDRKFYSSGPFQNFGQFKKKINVPEYGYTYYFEYGNTADDYDPNATYGSKHPHYYLYLDQDTINKPHEVPRENVFKISDDAINMPLDDTVVATRVAGKKRKTRKTRKSKKTRNLNPRKSRKTGFRREKKLLRKITRNKDKSIH